MIGLGLAGDLTLFPLLFVRLSLCLSLVVGFILFFWLQFGIWVDLILVSNCGGWFVVEVGCSGGDGGYLCLFFKL